MNNKKANDGSKDKLNDLLRRAENAQALASVNTKGGVTTPANGNVPNIDVHSHESISAIADGARSVGKNLSDMKEAAGGFKDHVLKPIWHVISPPLKFVANMCGAIWDKFAYKKDEDGERKISRKRAGIILGAAFLAAASMTPTDLGAGVRYVTIDPITDAAVMMVTMKQDETVFLSKTQEVKPEMNLHRVQGCLTAKCDASETVTYNVQPRLSHSIWNLATKGNPFFVPDLIVAAIPPGLNQCTVTSYSARFSGAKYVQMYPQLLDVQCTPVYVAPDGAITPVIPSVPILP